VAHRDGRLRFALAHMSCAGAWAWGEVPERLRAAGHTVVAPSFRLVAGATPADHAAELVAAAGEADVVAGHSYGGLVAPIAAESLGAAALVVIDGFVVDDGESAADVHPERIGPRREEAAARGDGMWTAGAADPRFVPMPLSCFEAPVALRGADVQRWFVHCLRSDFAAQAARARERGWRVVDVDAEHMLPLIDPAFTAKVLIDAGGSVRSGH
jgi:pimeloyl-ACP methyl ester carboxylesterase